MLPSSLSKDHIVVMVGLGKDDDQKHISETESHDLSKVNYKYLEIGRFE